MEKTKRKIIEGPPDRVSKCDSCHAVAPVWDDRGAGCCAACWARHGAIIRAEVC